MVSHLIHSMFIGPNKKYVINDLRKFIFDSYIEEKENIKFLRPTSLKYQKRKILHRDRIPNAKKDFFEDSYSFTPIFSTGRVIASGMMAPILYQVNHH